MIASCRDFKRLYPSDFGYSTSILSSDSIAGRQARAWRKRGADFKLAVLVNLGRRTYGRIASARLWTTMTALSACLASGEVTSSGNSGCLAP